MNERLKKIAELATKAVSRSQDGNLRMMLGIPPETTTEELAHLMEDPKYQMMLRDIYTIINRR